MTTFGWKRKIGEKVTKDAASVFSSEDSTDESLSASSSWSHKFRAKKMKLSENHIAKSSDLKEEGVKCAERGRFMEAVEVWDKALQLTPSDAKLLEMKAQSARKAVMVDPSWWVAYQTLGRAQLGIGEIKMAVISFSKALHINPACSELWNDDLKWAVKLLEEKLRLEADSTSERSVESHQVVCSENGTVVNMSPSDFAGNDIVQSRS